MNKVSQYQKLLESNALDGDHDSTEIFHFVAMKYRLLQLSFSGKKETGKTSFTLVNMCSVNE